MVSKIKISVTKKLWLTMFFVGLSVLVSFLGIEYIAHDLKTKKVYKDQLNENFEILIKNIANNTFDSQDIKNIAPFFNGGINLIYNENSSVSFKSNSKNEIKAEILYKSDINERVKQNLKDDFFTEEFIELENGDNILLIGKKIWIKGDYRIIYTYTLLPNAQSFKYIIRAQIIIYLIALVLIIYVTKIIFNKYFLKPIININKSVNSLIEDHDNYEKIITHNNDEIGELASSVNILADKLDEIEILRRELIANISHELRSPLVLIRGYSELIRDVTWKDEFKRNEHLNLIINESVRMSEMIHDIMDYSQLKAGIINLNKRECNVISVIKNEYFIAKKECELVDIKISYIDNNIEKKYAEIDDLKMSQVFRNLLNNAINHTHEGDIKVVLSEEKNKLRIEIINTGETIPQELQEKLFEKYYRVQHQASRKQGTGIGLSIVKTVCELHNFDYGVISENDVTTFFVVIDCN